MSIWLKALGAGYKPVLTEIMYRGDTRQDNVLLRRVKF